MRHAEAEDFSVGRHSSEDQRALTKDGIRKLRELGPKLRLIIGVPDAVLSSPLLRACQTAEIVAQELGYKSEIEVTAALNPEAEPEALLSVLQKQERVLLVGHLPHLPELARFLLGTSVTAFSLKKAGLCSIETTQKVRAGCGILKWLVSPKLLLS